MLLAYLYLLSLPPPPIPLLHCLFSASILFWLNGHKHKLSISSKSWSWAWQMKITLVKEPFRSTRPGPWPPGRRRSMWKVKNTCHCPKEYPPRKQNKAFTFTTTSSQEKEETEFRPPTPFQERNKTAFYLFPNSLNTVSSKGKHWFANTSSPGTAVHPTLPFNMKSAGCAVHPTDGLCLCFSLLTPRGESIIHELTQNPAERGLGYSHSWARGWYHSWAVGFYHTRDVSTQQPQA